MIPDKKIWTYGLMAFLGALVGGATVYALTKGNSEWVYADSRGASDPFDVFFAEQEKMFDRYFGRDFFREDPFEELRRMRGRMDQTFGVHTQFREREDDAYVYYDILINDLAKSKIETQVENGYVTITGETRSAGEGDSSVRSFTSRFQRTFPVPENVDPEKMEMVTEEGKLTLKFPKRS